MIVANLLLQYQNIPGFWCLVQIALANENARLNETANKMEGWVVKSIWEEVYGGKRYI